ncbi:hypothetical protein [Limoniibacter endophyticus]|uniref:Uncharacterized protein n=1 Tax=Limoniibacter endophyticus TaxID=1565040 RepID=A0A8J3DLI2_9HYPH|nr:hypothetical protein [Limoniibacter endophyticus]GHC61689.1 hypothetical protein GCM10010136_02390 [Limoniibacter endophyticus]
MQNFVLVDDLGDFVGFTNDAIYPPIPIMRKEPVYHVKEDESLLIGEDGSPVQIGEVEVIDGYERNPAIPETAIEISDEEYCDFLDNQGQRQWDANLKKFVEYVPPPVAPSVDSYRVATQAMLDNRATERQYDSGATLASYVNSTIPQWAQEAQAFVAWRDQVWSYALTELSKVEAGERDIPTIEDFLAELPAFEWPSSA